MTKKRRRYRINWDALRPVKKNKAEQKIQHKILAILMVAVLLFLAVFKLPGFLVDRQLQELGYTKPQIEKIREDGYAEIILKERCWSQFLAESIISETFDPDYIPLYLAMPEGSKVTADDLLLYNRLEEIGYETDQIRNLFSSLTFKEIVPLCVFDYQYNEKNYINDVLANREQNADGGSRLTYSYIENYKDKVINPPNAGPDMLINKIYLLAPDYIPSDLTSPPAQFAVDGVQLTREVTEAFTEMAAAAYNAGYPIYAIVGYRSYEEQSTFYKNATIWYGADAADNYAARAGASEHQSGLCLNLTCVGEDTSNFDTTKAFAWLKDHSAEYGFILRYPNGTKSITGFDYEPDHFRYVGKALAKEVKESGLTYDEFWCLYLKPWHDDTFKPKESILQKVYPNIQDAS